MICLSQYTGDPIGREKPLHPQKRGVIVPTPCRSHVYAQTRSHEISSFEPFHFLVRPLFLVPIPSSPLGTAPACEHPGFHAGVPGDGRKPP